MKTRLTSRRRHGVLAPVLACAALTALAAASSAKDVLVADRLSNNVYRFSATGALLGTVLPPVGEDDPLQLNQPVGLALSPDLKHLFVSSFQNGRVLRYNYNYATGTASAGMIFADSADGLLSPNAIQFSPDGDTIYVSNLGGTGVARFNVDGSSAGPPIFFGAPPASTSQFQFSGLTFTPSGQLLVGAFQDFPAGNSGAVGRYTEPAATMDVLLPSATSLNGASGLLVHEGSLYVTGMFAGNIQRFDLATGARDTSFLISDLPNPQALRLSPDGQGFLAGVLGLNDGEGRIAHYDFTGALLGDGVFATNDSSGGGFTEATEFIIVPDPPPGDFNLDFVVDDADLAIWRANAPNATGAATRAMGDADGNGLVNGHDLLVWQRNVSAPANSHPALTPGVATPEPQSISLACIITLVGLSRARLRRRQTNPSALSHRHADSAAAPCA